ncbi:TfoX N-terminal domain-containing protein [Chitinophaga jiangningensis]|uniref:TfoX N-terminal domain-containing protein n=1 Tax=Chitinophaga jiangningensis TaxID=1419482 RepID=A0A1M7J099_9BACT|nr:TfoX/Sxy family protein [Chitinophaga jiangningensis]SHM45857.1 TfoX N-terminal domain-containing protein [Chitinophaga jiangningensis]
MAYDQQLASRVREYLTKIEGLHLEEKAMFGGLAFLVNGKMCVNVSGLRLMCRFDPALNKQLSMKPGYQPMVMKGKTLDGYCYVEPVGFKKKKDFVFWMETCLAYNQNAGRKK